MIFVTVGCRGLARLTQGVANVAASWQREISAGVVRTMADARKSWRYEKLKANGRRGLKFQALRNAVIMLTGASPGVTGLVFYRHSRKSNFIQYIGKLQA